MNGNDPSGHEADSSSWAGVLIICCLALGFLAAMFHWEQARYQTERDRAATLLTAAELGMARAESLGRNLADPRTRLIHLSGPLLTEAGGAALAYNEAIHWAALFCDRLPRLDSGRHYEIWAGADQSQWVRLASIDAEPGTSVYAFHWSAAPGRLQRIEISAGPRVSQQPPLLSGQIQ